MNEPYIPWDPPEIRIPLERLQPVEFAVDLGEPRPELLMLEMVRDWVAQQAPLTVVSLTFSYQPASDRGDPSVLLGILTIGESLDLG